MNQGSSDLLVRHREGDPLALPELVEGMGPRLKGFFLRQGAQINTADDLAQDVFVRALQGLDRYQPAGRLDAFLLRIARNLWIDHCRRKRPLPASDAFYDNPDPGAGPSDLALQKDRTAWVRAQFCRLEESTRELLDLAILQRLPYAEVSVILGIPVGTVKSRVHYALRHLREHFSHGEDFVGEDS